MIQDRIVGLDPGVHTGFAIWSCTDRKLVDVQTTTITAAMTMVRLMHDFGSLHSVVFEDARLRKWFGEADARHKRSGAGIREGVGSVKRDCSIWQEFLEGLAGVPFKPVSPQSKGAKLNAAQFAKLTGWTGRTSEHGRDAAMLIYGLKT